MQNGQLSHEDLNQTGRFILGPNYTDDVGTGVMDEHGHGTHVTGIAAAHSNNNTGITGLNWQSDVLVIKTNDKAGFSHENWFYQAVKYASDFSQNSNRPVVINFSTSDLCLDTEQSPCDKQVYIDAIEYANERDVLIVAPVGNRGDDPLYSDYVHYPARYAGQYNNVIAAASTDPDDEHSSFSNSGSQVTMSAPGGANLVAGSTGNIYSTMPNYTVTWNSKGYLQNYDYAGGTSMAAPQIAATAALMLSLKPDMTPSQIRDALISTIDKVPGMNGENSTVEYGYGRINAFHAVKHVEHLAKIEHVQEFADQFESLSSTATAGSQGRRAVTDPSDGSTHIVYESDGLIVYYSVSSSGTSSQPGVISTVQNKSFGSYSHPNIVIDDTFNRVVFTKKINNSEYKITRGIASTSDGVSFGFAGSGEILNQSMHPQPKIAGNYSNDGNLMITYRTPSGIKALVWDDPDWLEWNGSDGLLPGTAGSHTNITAIASELNGNTAVNIVYQEDSLDSQSPFDIQYQCYEFAMREWSSPLNLSAIIPGVYAHYQPSISNSPDNGSVRHVAWTRTDGPNNDIVHRWSDLNNCEWPNVYTVTTSNGSNPTISGVENNKAWLFYEDPTWGIIEQEFSSTYWYSPVIYSSSGINPSLSTGGSQTRLIYTEDSGPPYEIKSYQSKSKQAGQSDSPFDENNTVYKRSIALIDTSGAFLELVVHNIEPAGNETSTNGQNLIPFNQNKADLDIENVFRLFAANTSGVLSGETVTFDLDIRGQNADQLFADGNLPQLRTGFEQAPRENDILIDLAEAATAEEYSAGFRIQLPVEESGEWQPILRFENLATIEDVFASVGHIYEHQVKKPEEERIHLKPDDSETIAEIELVNYPNPFNPVTNINFTLPETGNVTLEVYDLIGRSVAVLVSGIKEAGSHNIRFDGSNLASGMYIYRLEFNNREVTQKMLLIK